MPPGRRGALALLLAGLLVCGPVRPIASAPRAVSGEVYLDEHPAASKLLARAANDLRDKDWRDALGCYDTLLEQHGRRVMRLPESPRCVPVWWGIQAEIWPRAPEAFRSRYHAAHDRDAAVRWDRMRHSRDPEALEGFVRRFGFTPAGRRAALRLGDLAFEQGKTPLAVWYWNFAARVGPSPAHRVEAFHRAAIALRWAGDPLGLERLRRGLDPADAAVPVGSPAGQQPFDALLTSWMKETAETSLPAGTWNLGPDFQWGPAPEASGSGRLEPAWEAARPPARPGGEPGPDATESAEFLWVAATPAGVARPLGGTAAFYELSSGRMFWRPPALGGGPVSGEPSPLPRAALLRGEEVWTHVILHRQTGDRVSLAAFDRDGRWLHRLFDARQWPSLQAWTLLGVPVFSGDRLYTFARPVRGANAEGELHLLCLEPRRGLVRWSLFVVAEELQGGERAAGPAGVPTLTATGGVLFASTQCGVVAAVEAERGGLMWASRYKGLGLGAGESGGSWAPTPPMPAGSHLIVTPSDAHVVLALDRGSGAFVWCHSATHDTLPGSETPAPEAQEALAESVDSLAGRRGSRLYFGGGEILELDLDTGHRLAFNRYVLSGRNDVPSGRCTISGDTLYCPTQKGIAAFRLGSLKRIQTLREASARGPGDLIAAGEFVLKVVPGTLRAWKRASDPPLPPPPAEPPKDKPADPAGGAVK